MIPETSFVDVALRSWKRTSTALVHFSSVARHANSSPPSSSLGRIKSYVADRCFGDRIGLNVF
jgi:hypothetical protein